MNESSKPPAEESVERRRMRPEYVDRYRARAIHERPRHRDLSDVRHASKESIEGWIYTRDPLVIRAVLHSLSAASNGGMRPSIS
jgi:hypothetical protein